jgi:Holliday junction resolvase RusA-like endonuclease
VRVFDQRWPTCIIIEIDDADFFRERGKSGKMGGALMPTKNRAHGAKRGGGKFVTPRQKHFRGLIAWHCKGLEVGLGSYRLQVEQVCRARRRIGAMWLPQPDSDACLTAIRDAIETRKDFTGLVLDDAQIVDNAITSTLSTSAPRSCSLRIELTAMPQRGAGA